MTTTTGDPVPADDYSTAELVRTVQRIETAVEEIRSDVKALPMIYATKESVAELKDSLGREIRDIRLEQRAKATPWPQVASALTAIVALAITLVQLLTRT